SLPVGCWRVIAADSTVGGGVGVHHTGRPTGEPTVSSTVRGVRRRGRGMGGSWRRPGEGHARLRRGPRRGAGGWLAPRGPRGGAGPAYCWCGALWRSAGEGRWGRGRAACAVFRRAAAAAAGRGPADPRRAGRGGEAVPAVGQ